MFNLALSEWTSSYLETSLLTLPSTARNHWTHLSSPRETRFGPERLLLRRDERRLKIDHSRLFKCTFNARSIEEDEDSMMYYMERSECLAEEADDIHTPYDEIVGYLGDIQDPVPDNTRPSDHQWLSVAFC